MLFKKIYDFIVSRCIYYCFTCLDNNNYNILKGTCHVIGVELPPKKFLVPIENGDYKGQCYLLHIDED